MARPRKDSGQGRTIFALDVSLSATGWALVFVKDGSITLIDCGEVRTNPKKTHGERLHHLRSELLKVFEKHNPDDVVREAGFARYANATQVLYKAYGVAEEAFAEHGKDVPSYSATTVKKVVGESGRASKADVEAGVRKVMNLPEEFAFESDNVSDAVAVAITHCVKKFLV